MVKNEIYIGLNDAVRNCPAHSLVEISIFPTKEKEFKQESHAKFHILLRREYLGQI